MMQTQCLFTDTDIEVPAVTTSEMRGVDRIAMQETGPNLFQMMENAGRNLAEMALEHLGKDWTGKKQELLYWQELVETEAEVLPRLATSQTVAHELSFAWQYRTSSAKWQHGSAEFFSSPPGMRSSFEIWTQLQCI